MTCSIDFRRKVSEIKKRDDLSPEEAVLRSGISESGVFRWSKRLEPCRTGNRPAAKIDMAAPARGIEQEPDIFLIPIITPAFFRSNSVLPELEQAAASAETACGNRGENND